MVSYLLMVCTKGKFTANDYQKEYLPTSNSLFLEHTKSIWLIPYYFVVSVYLFSGFVILHYEVDTLKSSLCKISRKRDFVDKCFKKLLIKILVAKLIVNTYYELILILPVPIPDEEEVWKKIDFYFNTIFKNAWHGKG